MPTVEPTGGADPTAPATDDVDPDDGSAAGFGLFSLLSLLVMTYYGTRRKSKPEHAK